MPLPSISPQLQKQMQLNKQRDARKKVPGIRHPLLLSFLAGKLAFKHIYKDDDSLYDAIKSTPVFANILDDLEVDSVFVLYSALSVGSGWGEGEVGENIWIKGCDDTEGKN